MTRRATAHPAEQLVEQAQADPADYRRRVDEHLERYDGDAVGRAHVRWGLGLALRELGRLGEAREELERAVEEAGDIGPAPAARIRSSLALVLLHLGDAGRALAETESAADALGGVHAARNEMQRGVILQRLGRQDEAIAVYDLARPLLEAEGDRAAESRLLANRGVLHAYRGALGAAQRDLERSLRLARELGAARPIALGLQNLGFVAGRQGRLADALVLLEEADRLLRDLDDDAALAVLDMDRAELLADAGLLDEAIERAEAAAYRLGADRINGAEADLLVARLSLVAGRTERATALADDLVERFRDSGREGWALQARYIALAGRVARFGPGGGPLDEARSSVEGPGDREADVAAIARLAHDLERGGWSTEAGAAWLFAAREALADGRREWATELLGHVLVAARHAPALTRAQHWYATALLRADASDRAGARRAIGAGLAVLDSSRLAFGSAELRAHAVAKTVDLVELAVRLALEDGRPAEALRALDRVRATDVGVRIRPPEDPRVAADLAELRRVTEQERVAAREGDDVRPIVADRARLERRLRDRTRAVAADGGDVWAMRLDVAALRRALAGRTLAAYLHLDGRLHLIEVAPRVTRHHVLGPLAEVAADVAYLRAAVRRLAHQQGSAASLEAAAASLSRSAVDLTRRLGIDRLDPAGLVVVPCGVLDGLPWGALADDAGRLPTVSPSAGAWLRARGRVSAGATGLLVAGPDLPGAAREVEELAVRHPEATVLMGPDATVRGVLAQMQRAEIVHLAAHGAFRPDNPLLSSLRLADGALTVYEMEGLVQVPRVMVLPSCAAAATTTVGGDAVLGISSVLLRLGVSSVIAPVVEIPDEATRPLMLDLHVRLLRGEPPQQALGGAIGAAPAGEAAERAVRAAFMIVGR